MTEPADPVDAARHAVLELVEREHAVTIREIDARLCEARRPDDGPLLDPHVVRTARLGLVAAGSIRPLKPTPSHGGRQVHLLASTRTGRALAVNKAANRKRHLLGRYYGWAFGTGQRPGLIGPAAERVVQHSLISASAHGYQILAFGDHEMSRIVASALPGPLDNAAILRTPRTDGPVLVAIEVKNGREWLYPRSAHPYQLLVKATLVQDRNPDLAVLPVLICRRAHPSLVRMGRDLGFVVLQTRRQFLPLDLDEQEVEEVRTGIGFADLVRLDAGDETLVDKLTVAVPRRAAELAERWRSTTASTVPVMFPHLRVRDSLEHRDQLVDILRTLALREGLARASGGW